MFFLMSCSQNQDKAIEDTTSAAISGNNQLSGQEVIIKNYAFSPEILTVPAGATVIWVNEDAAPHIIQSDLFTSNTLNTGDSFSYTFTTAGEITYLCSIHTSMKGKVVVQ